MKRRFAMLLLSAGMAGAQPVPNPLQPRLPALWWRQQNLVDRVGLTTDQQKKMDDNFQQSRVRLIELNAAVDKEEALLDPLVAADKPDEAKIRTQIDRIAQARAELEKVNGYMLLGVRMILTGEQWKKLQEPGGTGPRPRKVKQ